MCIDVIERKYPPSTIKVREWQEVRLRFRTNMRVQHCQLWFRFSRIPTGTGVVIEHEGKRYENMEWVKVDYGAVDFGDELEFSCRFYVSADGGYSFSILVGDAEYDETVDRWVLDSCWEDSCSFNAYGAGTYGCVEIIEDRVQTNVGTTYEGDFWMLFKPTEDFPDGVKIRIRYRSGLSKAVTFVGAGKEHTIQRGSYYDIKIPTPFQAGGEGFGIAEGSKMRYECQGDHSFNIDIYKLGTNQLCKSIDKVVTVVTNMPSACRPEEGEEEKPEEYKPPEEEKPEEYKPPEPYEPKPYRPPEGKLITVKIELTDPPTGRSLGCIIMSTDGQVVEQQLLNPQNNEFSFDYVEGQKFMVYVRPVPGIPLWRYSVLLANIGTETFVGTGRWGVKIYNGQGRIGGG